MKRFKIPWAWAAAVLATVGCLSAWFVFGETRVYEAHASLELDRAGTSSQLELIQDNSLVLKAARHAGLKSSSAAALLADVKMHLSLRYDAVSSLVHMAFRASDPRIAAKFANSLIDGFLDEERSRRFASSVEWAAQVEKTASSIQTFENRRTAPMGLPAAETQALVRDRRKLTQQYTGLIERVPKAPEMGRVIWRAEIPEEAINSNPSRGFAFWVPICLVGGLLFLVSRRQVKRVSESVVLQGEVMTPIDGEKPVVAMSNVGTNFTNPDTLFDYVESLAGSGRSVLMVDCEFGGALTAFFGLQGEDGFSDFLALGSAHQGGVPAWNTDCERVSFMPLGTMPNRIPSLLAASGMKHSLAVLLDQFDRIVINAPPTLTAGEMRELSSMVDGVILVTSPDRSQSLVALAALAVEEYGGNVIGLMEESDRLLAA